MLGLKNKLITGLLAITIALGLFGFVQYKRASNLSARVSELGNFVKAQNDTISTYQNKLGQAVASIEALELSNKSLRDIKETIMPLVSQFEGVNKRLSNLEMLANSTFKAVKDFELDTKDSVIYLPDSTKINVWAFKEEDKYFSLSGYVEPIGKRVFATPSLNGEFTAALISRRNRFLGLRIGKKVERFELTSPNPYITFTDITFYKKKE